MICDLLRASIPLSHIKKRRMKIPLIKYPLSAAMILFACLLIAGTAAGGEWELYSSGEAANPKWDRYVQEEQARGDFWRRLGEAITDVALFIGFTVLALLVFKGILFYFLLAFPVVGPRVNSFWGTVIILGIVPVVCVSVLWLLTRRRKS